jgi:hypothetical protein
VLLLAMQMMRFFLRTGYGELDRSYGGLTEDRTQKLGQGIVAAGPRFLAISAQIVNAYLQDGHGARMMTSLSHCCFILAAVLYVDDVDNIHVTALMLATLKELIDHAQLLMNAWGGLAIATGATMKPDKCFAYFLVYNFSNSRPLMGTIGSLPAPASSILQLEGPSLPSHMTVPLPEGSSAPIPTLPPTPASLMLGIWFGPASQGTKHIAKMCRKCNNWADHLYSRPLPHSEAWTSFLLQLFPGMSWGISTIVLSPRELYLATKPVYYRCLPLLGVQRHVELPWQTLPKAYQGIGLPNLALHLLASKLQLIQCIWGFKDGALIALWMGYETFIMDIWMYGNPFSLNYKLYSILATNRTWFKNAWELLHKFKTIATISTDNHIHPVRVSN